MCDHRPALSLSVSVNMALGRFLRRPMDLEIVKLLKSEDFFPPEVPGVGLKMGVPQNGWFVGGNPIKHG